MLNKDVHSTSHIERRPVKTQPAQMVVNTKDGYKLI